MTTDASTTKLDLAKAGLTPIKLIQTYNCDEWEAFVFEWLEGFDATYKHVVKLAGAGDKGRDVVGYLGCPQTNCDWDSFQCKHYDHALAPNDIYTELGKLCVYTFKGDFSVPRSYRFAAPRGVGVKLHDMLRKPYKLRAALVENWANHCEEEISKAESFPLVNGLAEYVAKFDFARVWYLNPGELLEQHRKTKYWKSRFPSEPIDRPKADAPPLSPQQHELVYLAKLLAAYSDHSKTQIASLDELKVVPPLEAHLKRSRGYFYSAEALARFSRDNFTPRAFEGIREHVFDGVADTTLASHENAFQCVLAVTEVAAQLTLPKSDLEPYVGPADKKGICHHLANDDKLDWNKQ